MWKLRQAIPATTALRNAESATLRARLIKVAARVVETASSIRIAFASAGPGAAIFKAAAITLRMASP
ncbi:hypothetical protein GCM10007973_16470 [Polymorphobacter multimanifer]|uniref:Transposase DDE domain-containing protein n=1 Tax=Polymorphobacter multimanifer TaxID=1070431 RepID=A0A841LJR9_9SPHN|nr:hypothetical protein [Polymorphobacter multimanifer]GGI80686.1 hypothetical protein GCM10007973_16470 [Polymorphobacter multimanifer]